MMNKNVFLYQKRILQALFSFVNEKQLNKFFFNFIIFFESSFFKQMHLFSHICFRCYIVFFFPKQVHLFDVILFSQSNLFVTQNIFVFFIFTLFSFFAFTCLFKILFNIIYSKSNINIPLFDLLIT